jgi:protein TonB
MVLALLSACNSPPFAPRAGMPRSPVVNAEPTAPPLAPPTPIAAPTPIVPQSPAPVAIVTTPVPAKPVVVAPALPRQSNATTDKAYRADAAAHLYALNKQRIYPGRLPPNLYAIGVLDVSLDGRGQVLSLKWQRAPNHAPEVIAEIERTVRAAAPFPAPTRMRQATYTDVWLWHRSGNFQLDTLTEGQD